MLRSVLGATTTLLATLIACSTALSQPDQTVFVELNYMRSMSPDYAQIESEIWKPIHQERIERGQMLNWAVYGVRFGDLHDYDYITVNVYDSIEDVLTFGALEDLVRAAHPNRSVDEITESVQSRQLVRSELWTIIDGVSMDENGGAPRFLDIAYMKIPQEGAEAYVDLEQEIWMPMHEASLGQGGKVGWDLYSLNWPYGSQLPYEFATINQYSSTGEGPSYQELAGQVHPGMSWDDLVSRTAEARDLVFAVMFELVDSTD